MISGNRQKGACRRGAMAAGSAVSRRRHALPSLGDLVFKRDADRPVDMTAILCGDPAPGRSALDERKERLRRDGFRSVLSDPLQETGAPPVYRSLSP